MKVLVLSARCGWLATLVFPWCYNFLHHMTTHTVGEQIYNKILNDLRSAHAVFTVIEHAPVFTMQEAQEVVGSKESEEVKVVFVRVYETKKTHSFALIVWTGNKPINYKKVAEVLGAKKVSMASSEEVEQHLGIKVGALTPFGYVGKHRIIIDASLLVQEFLYINPGLHDKTIRLNASDFKHLVTEAASSVTIIDDAK